MNQFDSNKRAKRSKGRKSPSSQINESAAGLLCIKSSKKAIIRSYPHMRAKAGINAKDATYDPILMSIVCAVIILAIAGATYLVFLLCNLHPASLAQIPILSF
jgi:hypothetical protein